MPTDSTIECYDRHAYAFDLYQTAVVPQYTTALEVTAMAARRYAGHEPTLIDLGCGTGNASAAILKLAPRARIFLLDGSASMVEAARRKIEAFAPGAMIGSKVADLSQEGWEDGVGSGYDAIVSTLVLEHLPNEWYKAVLQRCYHLLKPGGWLLAVEGYEEEESDMLPWFQEQMEARRKLIQDPKLSEFVARLREEKEVHYYTSKAEKASWWRGAGFDKVQVLWQYLCLGLMAGRRLQY
jgi:tRNA (cmo5U34)-methyltransferase